MKNPALLLLYILLLASCAGQQKTEQVNEKPSLPQRVTGYDQDQYFVESEELERSYGPISITRNAIEDREGNIWLATWEGIMRYDGKTFTNFTNKDSLRRYHVFSAHMDQRGDLWFGTIGAGLYHYDGNTFRNYTEKDGLVNDNVACFYEDKTGKLWIGTMGGISIYDPSLTAENGILFQNLTMEDGLSDNDVNCIVEDGQGMLWIATRGEACTFYDKTFKVIKNELGQPFTNVRCVIKDKKGHLWLAGQPGLYSYDGMRYRQHSTAFTGYVYEDSKGSLWTSSSENGNDMNALLSRWDLALEFVEKYIPTSLLTERNMFFGIMEDTQGAMWLCHGNGVMRNGGEGFERFGEE